MCSRWVMARFDPLGAVATFATTLLVLYTRTSAGLGGVRSRLLLRATRKLPTHCFLTFSTFTDAHSVVARTYDRHLLAFSILERVSRLVNFAFVARAFLTFSLSLCSMEMRMNAVERVLEYSSIPQEARLLIPENTPPAYWPSNSGETLVGSSSRLLLFPSSIH